MRGKSYRCDYAVSHAHTFSRALHRLHVFALIGSQDRLCRLWLASMMFLVLVLRHSIGHFRVTNASATVSKRVVVQNLSYENKFDLHENELVGGAHSQWMVSFWYRGESQLGNGLLRLALTLTHNPNHNIVVLKNSNNDNMNNNNIRNGHFSHNNYNSKLHVKLYNNH